MSLVFVVTEFAANASVNVTEAVVSTELWVVLSSGLSEVRAGGVLSVANPQLRPSL